MNKTFYTQNNIGNAKYVVNFHNGVSAHRDGSEFFDIAIFKSKAKLKECIDKLLKEGYVERGISLTPTNLNMLFIDQITNFQHLVSKQKQTKAEFLATIEKTYSTENPKTALFYQSAKRSEFETIRKTDSQILFNQ